MSEYQAFKLALLKILSLSKDAVHIHIGFLCFLAAVLIFKFPASRWKSLIPAIAVAVFMEALDIRDELVYDGEALWLASLHDIFNTLWIPMILHLTARARSANAAELAERKPVSSELV